MRDSIVIDCPEFEFARCGQRSSAASVARLLHPSCAIMGMTDGSFSLIDLLVAIVNEIGACDVQVVSFTVGLKHAALAHHIVRRGLFRNFKLVIDAGYPSIHPQYVEKIVDLFGVDALRVTKTHAKFALLSNADWSVVVCTSMNLNENRRIESFQIFDNKAIHTFHSRLIDSSFALTPPGITGGPASTHAATTAFFEGTESCNDLISVDTPLISDFD